jgi:prophage maintenance system killer protein
MNTTKPLETTPQGIEIYQTEDGSLVVDVRVEKETLWLSLNQIAALFGRDKSVVSRHLKNIFQEGELVADAVVAKFATTADDGKTYQVDHYNLDVIISVGYRVNSKRGTQFRQWASNVLKDYWVQGYALNQKQLHEQSLRHLQQTITLMSDTLRQQNLVDEVGDSVLYIIQEYAKTWDLLLQYDENCFNITKQNSCRIRLSYPDSLAAVHALKIELAQHNEHLALFGQERGNALQAILGNLDQTFDGIPLYPSCEERAAHLLYFIIKDHPFNDGNKRIASLLFLVQLRQDGLSLQKINDKCLVALTLLVAQSHPNQKDIMIQLIISLFQS